AAGVADHAAEFAAAHRQPQVLEDGGLSTIRAGVAPRDALDGNEFVGHALFRKRDHAREARKDLVEQHADDADQENGDDDVGDREVVPLVPDEVADAGAADQHLGRDDHEPGDADRYPHAG